jgi:hypothetical protein
MVTGLGERRNRLCAFPRRLKPDRFDSLCGAAEAAPFQYENLLEDV